jgi:hypothetical protein
VRVERTVTDIAQQEPVLVVGHATDLAPLALLALPAGADDGSDAHLGTRVKVVLPAQRAKQEVVKLVRGELSHLAVFPGAAVVQVLNGRIGCMKKTTSNLSINL